MLGDFFAPANLPVTLLCIVLFALAVGVQHALRLSGRRFWWLPMALTGGAAVLCLVLFFALFQREAWKALSWLFAALAALLLFLGCTLGYVTARWRQSRE